MGVVVVALWVDGTMGQCLSEIEEISKLGTSKTTQSQSGHGKSEISPNESSVKAQERESCVERSNIQSECP